LEALDGHQHLTSICITQYTNVIGDWAQLAQLSNLQRLALHNCPRSLRNEQCLGRLTQLQHLRLVNPHHLAYSHKPGGIVAITNLSALTDLTHLHVHGGSSSDLSGWHSVRPLQHLRELELVEWKLPAIPHTLSFLSSVTHLSLYMTRPAINSWPDSGWQHLASLTSLAYLNLSSCGLTDGIMPQLHNLGHLRTLLLSQYRLKELPDGLGQATVLEVVDLTRDWDMEIGSPSWDQLLCLPRLASLDLQCCFKYSADRDLPYAVCELLEEVEEGHADIDIKHWEDMDIYGEILQERQQEYDSDGYDDHYDEVYA
jgi:hypothetical protein